MGLVLGLLVTRTIQAPLSTFLLVVTFVVCALLCTRAEQALGQHDPSAVIVDEVWAMAAIIVVFPALSSSWVLLVVAFLLFRTFDIAKPFPLDVLARLPGGWGIIADDLGAAVYAILVLWFISRFAK